MERTTTGTLLAAAALLVVACLPTAAQAEDNKYAAIMVGTWEVEGEADLIVLARNNSCYRMDEDGFKTSRRGRWNADSKRLTMELKYNGKKYRSVFTYKQVNEDQFQLTIVKAFVDGKPKKPKKSEITVRRKKKPAGGK